LLIDELQIISLYLKTKEGKNIMDIEKIKNYNQKMLAVFITIIVTAASIGLIALIVFIISELIPNRIQNNNTLLSDEKVEELKKDSFRQQIISYDSPILVDTLNLVYLIPVNVKTLDKPEETDKVAYAANTDFERSSAQKYSERSIYGSFNNLIIYDYKNQSSDKICEYRIIGTDLSLEYFQDEIIIVFTGAEKDTDGDKRITLLDCNSLFVYSLKNGVLRNISQGNSTVYSFEFIEGKKDILVTFGYDRDKNDKFDARTEPTFIMKYDYTLDKLVPIVDEKLGEDVQKIIDGN